MARSSPRRRTLVVAALATLFYAAATPWVLRPWFLGDDLLPRDESFFASIENADLQLNAWILAWVARTSLVDPGSLFDGNIFFPASNSLALSENMLAHLPVTAPAWALTESALTVLKAMALESFLLAGLGMFALIYSQTRNAGAALVAGAVFSLAPWRVQSFPHPQYLATGFLPLAFLAVDRWLERRRPWSLLGLAASIALQMLASLYLGYFILFGVLAYAGVRLLRAPSWRAALGVALASGGGILLALPAALPYARARAEGAIPPFDPERFAGHAWAPWDYASSAFVALAGLVVLGVVGIDLCLRAAARLRGRRIGLSMQEWAAWAVVGIGVLLSTGPYLTLPGGGTLPTPYLLLYELVPGFSAIRGPRRFFILVLAGLSMLAGHALARWTARSSRPVAAFASLALACAAAVVAAPTPAPVMPAELGKDAPEVYRWLAAQPVRGGVLEMPSSAIDTDFVGGPRNARYMLWSTLHWQPLVNGYSGYEPPLFSFLVPGIRRLPDPRALEYLVNAADIRWIILHRDLLTGSETERWAHVDTPGLEPRARFGDAEIFEVTRAPTRSLRNRLGSTVMLEDAETVTGVLTAPLPARCRNARILSVDMPPVIALTAFPVPIAVRFENASGCTWPAVAIPAKGLVGLGYQWIDPEGKEQPPGAFTRLLADVAPGEQVDDTVVVVPPYGEPGTWRLSIFVGQNGEASPLAKVTRPVEVRRLGSAP